MTAARIPNGQLSLLDEAAPPRRPSEPRPGVVFVPDWLTIDRQRRLAADFPAWAAAPAGLRRPRVRSGHEMSIESVCLGWHWVPNRYVTHAVDVDGAPVKPLPDSLVALAREAVAAAYGADSAEAASYAPDASIVNRYGPGAPARPASGRRGALLGAGRHDQPGRHRDLPARRRQPSRRPVRRPRAAQR